jgi:hypothetical protein
MSLALSDTDSPAGTGIDGIVQPLSAEFVAQARSRLNRCGERIELEAQAIAAGCSSGRLLSTLERPTRAPIGNSEIGTFRKWLISSATTAHVLRAGSARVWFAHSGMMRPCICRVNSHKFLGLLFDINNITFADRRWATELPTLSVLGGAS